MLKRLIILISAIMLSSVSMALPYYINGRIDAVYSDSALLNDEVSLGDTFEIVFDYHPETGLVDQAGPGYQVYANTVSNLTVKINSTIVIQDSNPLTVSYNHLDPFTLQRSQVFGLAFNSDWDERGNADYWGLPLSEHSIHFELNLASWIPQYADNISPEFSLPETLSSSLLDYSLVRFAASLTSVADIHGLPPGFSGMTKYYDIVGSIDTIELAAVPEPGTAWLLLLALASVICVKRTSQAYGVRNREVFE